MDQLCDEFERSFKESLAAKGDLPRIEDYLDRSDPNDNEHSLRELLRVELELRRAAGLSPKADEYRQRFAEYRQIVESLVDTAALAGSGDPNSTIAGPAPAGAPPAIPPVATGTDKLPRSIGRYQIQKVLGRGGFAVVYLAHDPQLDREVALKVPRMERFENDEQLKIFVHEARNAAGLEHPGIVQVYDVQEQPGLVYIVQQYIAGKDLARIAATSQFSPRQIAKLLIRIAEAVGFAHSKQLIHRDLKLANILVDQEGRAFLADFGLALHASVQARHVSELAGTYPYMSPEQVRRESHRLDGRSDLWSLGIILYELLTKRRPFGGSGQDELFYAIQYVDPELPSQLNPAVSKDLDRICLTCLAKRASDRYQTAGELIDDLRHWLQPATESGQSVATKPSPIVPKGLRSYDANDADFFLELMPGPHDREGLPKSVRFWKNQIERSVTERTFTVGLMYGPSGCGKSSLVKAGLLPRLSRNVVPVYVEATAADTETRLISALRDSCLELPVDASLPELVALIRTSGGSRRRKVLLVIDQFEQWLHANSIDSDSQLVAALRQCDGNGVQCVILVRDDFYAAVNRFFQQIETPLVEGHNAALVDLFDPDHARKVLIALGRAYERLPSAPADLSALQLHFVDEAVRGLCREGKVVCIQLTVLADMMKGRTWNENTLREIGGTAGVGEAFLEEKLSAKTAPLALREHPEALRAILKELLPAVGTEIKGQMRSYDQLLDAAGYRNRRLNFDVILRVLDNEVRLITPTEPDGNTTGPVVSSASSEGRFYQLTHDYLVPSLRDWLTRKQRETMRGRVELLLSERAATWAVRPSKRHLPAWHEDLRIRLFTKRSSRKDVERRMLRASGWLHITRLGLGLFVALAIGLSVERFVASQRLENDRKRAASLVDAVLNAPPSALPSAIENLRPLGDLAMPLLRERVGDRTKPPAQRLHAAMTLADYGECNAGAIVESVSVAADGQCRQILNALAESPELAVKAVDKQLAATDPSDVVTRARLSILSLQFGNSEHAVELCSLAWDPTPKRVFEETLAVWHGDLGELLPIVDRVGNGPLRASVALGVGRAALRGAPEVERNVVTTTLTRWFMESPDTGTHGAADWALRQWSVALPTIESSTSSRTGHDWYVNSLGQTMLKITPRKFPMGEDKAIHGVELTTAYFLADREVSVGAFQQFMDDPDTPTTEKPAKWLGGDRRSLTAGHPVVRVNWHDAVLFCNWLSRREQRSVCYVREGKPDDWKLVPDANGYRLPTEVEWEYACRAGTTTEYSFGDDAELLSSFAARSWDSTAACGSKIPNAFGFFDLHGNVWEWCQDRYSSRPVDAEFRWDPNRPLGDSRRALRGGSWYVDSNCRTAYRRVSDPTYRSSGDDGFRLALGSSEVSPEASRAKEELAGPGKPSRAIPTTTRPQLSNKLPDAHPPLAIVPFTEVEAKQHQQAWAKYRGEPVEKEITLPGGEKLEMMLIPPGEFTRSENNTTFRVRLTKPFYFGKYEVTQAQWQSVMGTNPSQFKDSPKYPVEQVSWDDIQPFLARLNAGGFAEKMTFVLPTEAQWEYACRAGTTSAYSFGDSDADLPQYGWFTDNSDGKTHPVGQLQANPFGLYDLHGNLNEWCLDWHEAGYYARSPLENPPGPYQGSSRVLRGGNWGRNTARSRVAFRDSLSPTGRSQFHGFRLALIPSNAAAETAVEVPAGVDIANLQLTDPPQVVNDSLTFAYEIQNTSDAAISWPKREEKQLFRQHWVERLGSSAEIAAMSKVTFRDGARYAAGATSIREFGPTVTAGESKRFQWPLNIKDFPPGRYRFYVELQELPAKRVMHSQQTEFELGEATVGSPRTVRVP